MFMLNNFDIQGPRAHTGMKTFPDKLRTDEGGGWTGDGRGGGGSDGTTGWVEGESAGRGESPPGAESIDCRLLDC